MSEKYRDEMVKYMENLKEKIEAKFADFILIGIDVTGEVGQIISVGLSGENSMNKERLSRMVGELEDLKFNLQLASVGICIDGGDEEDDDEGDEFGDEIDPEDTTP